MVMEYFNIKMEQFMTVNGLMIKLRIKEKLYIQIKINMKETLLMVKNMEKASIIIAQEVNIKANG